MAKYNEILVGRYNRYLQKLLAMKGEPPASQLAGEITPSLTLFHGNENLYLQGWDLFGCRQNVAGVAAQQGVLRMRNPPGSNVVAVLTRLLYISAVADPSTQVRWSVAGVTVDLTTPGILPVSVDARTQRPGTVMVFSNVSTAAPPGIGNPLMQGTGAANAQQELIPPDQIYELPLLPGTTFDVICGVVNSSIVASYWWRERFLEDSERS